MKIKLVVFGDSLVNIGFRRISSLIKSKYPSVTTYFYVVGGISALAKYALFQQKLDDRQGQDDIFINPKLVEELSDADVIGFSGVSKFANHIKKTISLVTARNNKALIVWGGVHASVFPEDAIKYADAVCIGEGEVSFMAFLEKIKAGLNIGDCEGFWIKKPDGIRKNNLFPLMAGEDLSLMPFQDYGFDIRYVTDKDMMPMSKDIYISQEGSKYTTMWVMGCPFHCVYCSNNKFIKNHADYAKLRYADPEFVINEIADVLQKHDYVKYIELVDDNILMLNADDLGHFAELYKKKIGLPFFTPGLHPSTVNKEKLGILINAGLKKVRMGIQSGNKKTLHFYKRNTSREMILSASETLSSLVPKIIPPFYDMIVDNPIETAEDRLETLMLLRELKRPYLLYMYSLRIIPGTELYDFAKDNQQLNFRFIEQTYQTCVDKQTVMMMYFLSLFKVPDSIFNLFLKISKARYLNSVFFNIFKFLDLIRKFYYEISVSNFQPLSMISPKMTLFLYNKFNKPAAILSRGNK